jgi:hypothetical protein
MVLGDPDPIKGQKSEETMRLAHGEAEKHLGFNTVEYAVRTMMKGNSVVAAAKRTVAKFSGSENMFLAPAGTIVQIDAVELAEALWDRLVDFTVNSLSKIKPGFEHYALDGTIQHYSQGRFKKERDELKERVSERLGYCPFVNDVS